MVRYWLLLIATTASSFVSAADRPATPTRFDSANLPEAAMLVAADGVMKAAAMEKCGLIYPSKAAYYHEANATWRKNNHAALDASESELSILRRDQGLADRISRQLDTRRTAITDGISAHPTKCDGLADLINSGGENLTVIMPRAIAALSAFSASQAVRSN